MKRLWWLGGVLLSLSLIGAIAQTSSDAREKRATEISIKARQVDLLAQIMPLLLTSKQIDAILPSIDKARQEVRKAELKEYEFLLKIEKTLDTALSDAYKKDRSPSRDALAETYATFRMFRLRRDAIASENVDTVVEAVRKTLNKGQVKAMAGALKPSLIDPSIDPRKLDDEKRLRFFVSYILLDPAAYSVLSKLAAK